MPTVIDQLIPLADAHAAADEYVKGRYEWWGGACSIGCTIHDAKKLKIVNHNLSASNHKKLGEAINVPEVVLRLCDHIFEGLDDPARWTPRWMRAANGKDLSRVGDQFSVWCLLDPFLGLAHVSQHEDVRIVSAKIGKLYERRANGEQPADSEWKAVIDEADAARQRADATWHQADATWHQAYAAWRQADATWHQAYAAWRQADVAWQQADAARQRAYAASRQADAAWQQADAAQQRADAAWQQFWTAAANKLIQLMESAPAA